MKPGKTAASFSSSATAESPPPPATWPKTSAKARSSTDDLNDESKKRLKVLSLTDNVGWLLAVGNDCGYDQIFLQQLMNYGTKGDLLLAISGSGNSPNILTAVDWANRHGLTTFGLTGYNGGKLKQMQQHGLHVELDDMGMVESLHLAIFHWVLNDVFARINREGRGVAQGWAMPTTVGRASGRPSHSFFTRTKGTYAFRGNAPFTLANR